MGLVVSCGNDVRSTHANIASDSCSILLYVCVPLYRSSFKHTPVCTLKTVLKQQFNLLIPDFDSFTLSCGTLDGVCVEWSAESEVLFESQVLIKT